MLLTDKLVVLTGAAGLLGRVFSRAILSAGGNVLLTDIDVNALDELRDQLRVEFPDSRVGSQFLDINDESSVSELLASIEKDYGRADALVNNAYPRNANYGRHFFQVSHHDFCDNMGLNVGGVFLTCQQFARHFIANGGGNIVNIASIYGVVAPRFEIYNDTEMTMPVEYAAIKAAVIHLSRYLAVYLKEHHIRVNCLSPGGIENGQPEAFLSAYRKHCHTKGMLQPEDVASSLVYLLSDASCYVTGQNLVVDDGFSL